MEADLCAGHPRRAFDASRAVCRAAQDAQVIRPDFEHPDLFLLVRATDGLLPVDPGAPPAAAHRLSVLLLDAVREPPRHTELTASGA